jgi:iron complex transport system permease protein
MSNKQILIVLSLFLMCGIIGSLVIGDLPLPLLFHDLDLFWIVFEGLRLPRTLLALLTGSMLGLTGAVLQGYLRNPLADAGIIGISSAASFGSVLALSFGAMSLLALFCGILGALGLMIGLYFFSLKKSDILSLILIGLTFNSLFSSLTALTLNLSSNPYKNLEIMFWLLGSFTNQTLESILFTVPFLITGTVLLWIHRPVLDALALGEDMATTLGYSLKHTTQIIIIGTSLCIGPLTALGGTIGFVGLIVPHMIRYFMLPKPSAILLPSALGGAILCLLADIVIRLLPTNTEIKIGVITSLLGAPFFLFLILKKLRTFS